jgi:HK97 family phage prohead protease
MPTALKTKRSAAAEGDSRDRLWFDIPFTKTATDATSGEIVLSGYASTWGEDRDDEAVAEGAFSKSLAPYLTKNPMLLWQHQMDWPIGSVTSAETDANGLFVTASVPNPGDGAADWQKGAYTAIKTGVVRTFSIGGYMSRSVKQGKFVIDEVELFEISVVSIPANADSIFEAAVKALTGERPRLSEKAVAQMEQLIGFKAVTDPELVEMTQADKAERYGMLTTLFKDANGVEPPAFDDFRLIQKAITANVSPLKTAAAVALLSKTFYSPDVAVAEEKAGRTLSAVNKNKLQAALDAHEELADHMMDAAESMSAAAKAHATSVASIKDVMGITDEDGDDDPDLENEDPEDPRPNSPESAPKGLRKLKEKALISGIMSQLRQLGADRYASQTGEDVSFYVEDADLDAGYVIYEIYNWNSGSQVLYRVPILRGADGSVALGDGQTEVTSQQTYADVAPAATAGQASAPEGDTKAEPEPETPAGDNAEPDKKAAAMCPKCGAPMQADGKSCVSKDCTYDATDDEE